MAIAAGILRLDRIGQDGINPGPYNLLLYGFPKAVAERNGIYLIAFFSIHNKCYKYVTEYADDKFLKTLITKYDSPNSGLKRSGKGLIWVNLSKKYTIEILKTSRFTKGQPIKTTAFVLSIHKNDQEFN